MVQVYPIFTDGNKFYHMEENSPKGCRMAYFSKLKLKEWTEKEKEELTKKQAKRIFEGWNNKDTEQGVNE